MISVQNMETGSSKPLNNTSIRTAVPHTRISHRFDAGDIHWENFDKIFARERSIWEKEKANTAKRHPSHAEILKLLAAGAVIGLSLVIPTLPVAIAPFTIDRRRYKGRYFNQTIKRLKQQKLVEVVEEHGQIIVRITQNGKLRSLKYKLDELKIPKLKAWDNKWRVVIFDIPEHRKRMREIFRMHLKKLGFYPLQKSVWLHAFPCFDEIEFLRQIYHVGENVTYIIGEPFESTDALKRHFHLPA